MKLEKIVINGFKSFADKTEFDIRYQITAIVGPNGCGKSNVVDAIKWVLGSQSPKSLRSGQMTDVIFSGSSGRKPSGMAEVSLYFSDVRGLGLQQDDLQITRRLFRNGDSDYLMNGKTCRLRDIRELFMDTGIGVNAYSIIEQGQVEQLLKSSAVDRRVIFEEAAGISKYKAHKKEALRKLERADQNLLRLADIITEVQKQLRSIKLQAGKARSYLDYSQQLKTLRMQHALSEFHKIQTTYSEKQKALVSWEDRFSAIVASVSRCDAAVSQLVSALMDNDAQMNRWDNTLISLRSRIEQQHERRELLKNRLAELSERYRQVFVHSKQMAASIHQIEKQLSESQAELAQLIQHHQQQSHQASLIQSQLEQLKKQTAQLDAQLEDEKSGILDIVRRTAQLHNEIQSLSHYRQNLTGRKLRLDDKAVQASAQLSGWLIEQAQYQSRLEEIRAVLSELQARLDAKRAELERTTGVRGKLLEQIAAVKQQRSALMGEMTALKEMERRREGVSQTLQSLLCQKERKPYIEGLVADVLFAQPAYAAAVESALEGWADALLVSSVGALLTDSDDYEQLDQRVRIVCLDRLGCFSDTTDFSEHPAVIGRLVEFVRFDARYAPLAWQLLGRTVLVKTLSAALELSSQFGLGWRFVTPQGQCVINGCALTVGTHAKSAGLISRKSRILQLEEQIAGCDAHLAELQAQLQHTDQQNDHLSHLCQELRTSIYEANTEKVDAESQLRILQANIQRLTAEQPLIADEIQALQQEIEQSVVRENISKTKLAELEEISRQRNQRIEELTAAVQQHRHIQQTYQEQYTQLQVAVGRLAEQQCAVRSKISSLQSQMQQHRVAIESARTEMAACLEQIQQAERGLLAADAAVSDLYHQLQTAEQQSALLHRQAEVLAQQRRELDQQLHQFRQQQSEIEQAIHHLQLELGQLQVKREDLLSRTKDELNVELEQAYSDYRDENVDWEKVRQEIADLRAKIERLGNVNIDAIAQQEELEKRYQFLSAQVEDLQQSKQQLEQLISRINKESREKFEQTFQAVRVNFQHLFRKLFGGGKADILLENPDDILESGIEIIARPPGKETRSISLLSGGEKTMTAIALLFAIFQAKPSPFCVLDEVDAALDEANNERFNLIVKEFQNQSQFIIITHSKRTMSIADVLYGITMQTQGVSKKIAVRFDGSPAASTPQDSSEIAVA